MKGVICGTGACVPERVLDNHKIAEFVDTSDQWIRERTGVLRRHIAEKETTVSMGAEAARQAIEESGISSDEVDLIIAATSTPDQIFPCTACGIQKELELYQAAGFDLNAACSGFLFAYQTAQAYISSGIYKNILVVAYSLLPLQYCSRQPAYIQKQPEEGHLKISSSGTSYGIYDNGIRTENVVPSPSLLNTLITP